MTNESEHVQRTERKSFFRRLAEKKGSPRIDHETVLVMRKPGDSWTTAGWQAVEKANGDRLVVNTKGEI